MGSRDASVGITMGELIAMWAEYQAGTGTKVLVRLEPAPLRDGTPGVKAVVQFIDVGEHSTGDELGYAEKLWPTHSHKSFCGLLYYLTVKAGDDVEAFRQLQRDQRS